MDCFGTCFTHAQTSDVKPPCKRPRSPLQRWRQPLSSPLQAPSTEGFKPPWSPLQAPLKPSEGEAPLKPPSSPLQAPSSLSKPPSPSPPPPSPPDPSSPLEGGFWRGYLGTSPPFLAFFLAYASASSMPEFFGDGLKVRWKGFAVADPRSLSAKTA